MTITPEEIQEIRDMATKANSAGMSAAQFGVERCKLCIAVGDKLRAWKKVIPYGEFGKLRESVGLTGATSTKWMRASQAVEDQKIKLDDVNGIRQLYIMLGIVPKKTATERGEKQPATPVSHVTLAARLQESLEALPVKTWTILQRDNLKAILRPIVEFCRHL